MKGRASCRKRNKKMQKGIKKNKEEEVNNNEDKKQRNRLEYPGSDCPLICPKMEEYYKEKIKNQTSQTL